MKRINPLIGTIIAIAYARRSKTGVANKPLRLPRFDLPAGELPVLPPRPTKKELIAAKKAKRMAKGKVLA